MKAAFEKDVPPTWSVERFKVLASEEAGTKVSPEHRHRFEASVAPKADLLRKRGALQGTDVLEIAVKQGTEHKVIGTARSVLRAEAWHTVFLPETAPAFDAGQGVESFRPPHVVVGTAAYTQLIRTTRAALDAQAGRIETDQAAWMQGVSAHQRLSAERQDVARVSAERLTREREALQKQWQEAQVKSRQDQQARTRDLQGELETRLQPVRQARDAQLAELEKTHRLKVAELQARRAQVQHERSAGRTALRNAYNTEQAAARKAMDSAAYIAHRAAADDTLRSATARIDALANTALDAVRADEAALINVRRASVEQHDAAYRQTTESLRTALVAERGDAHGAAAQAGSDAVKTIEAAQKAALERHQAVLKDNDATLQAARAALDQQQRQITSARRQWQSEMQLIEALERG